MGKLDFNEIAHLLNHSRTTQIDLSPVNSKEGRWILYSGVHKIHTSSYAFKVIYFFAAASQEDIKSALEKLQDEHALHIVFAPSLESQFRGNREIRSLIEKNGKEAWSTREYLISFIKDEIQTYLERISNQAPADYIDPKVETPAAQAKRPNPILDFLIEPSYKDEPGKLAVVLAEPGQGKTYMSRYLVGRISRDAKNVVPLLVDSSQWSTMSVEDQMSLSKTIANSFRHFGATISWLENHEEEFLRATLKADLFRIVFDGFDEYILRNKGEVQPVEVLETLSELASTTGTKIIVTSRTSFWNSYLPETEVKQFLEQSKSPIYRILPFDDESAKNYFKQRFNGNKKTIQDAIHIYTSLRKGNEEIVGRGFVLSLVADLAPDSTEAVEKEIDRTDTMLWLARELCNRETLRHRLPFGPDEQIDIISTFAVDVAKGEQPNSELLELSMSVVRPNLDADSREAALEKFRIHALLQRQKDQDIWEFKQEQIYILLLANQIHKWSAQELGQFLERAELDPGAWQDLGEMVVGFLERSCDRETALGHISKIVGSASLVNTPRTVKLKGHQYGQNFGGIVALIAVDHFCKRGSPRDERAQLLLELCGNSEISGVRFQGTVSSYDFTGIHFNNCRLERLTWANCKFDEHTEFKKCSFLGEILSAHSESLGSVVMEDCVLDPDAQATFNSICVNQGRRRYTSDDLRSDFECVVRKFIIKGGIGLKSLDSTNMAKGRIGTSQYKSEIIEAIINSILEQHNRSGSLWYSIRKEAAESVKFYATNNVFTGPLRDAFDKLTRKLTLG